MHIYFFFAKKNLLLNKNNNPNVCSNVKTMVVENMTFNCISILKHKHCSIRFSGKKFHYEEKCALSNYNCLCSCLYILFYASALYYMN